MGLFRRRKRKPKPIEPVTPDGSWSFRQKLLILRLMNILRMLWNSFTKKV